MASTTALSSFFSSSPTAATIHKQNPPFLSKPNFSFFTPTSSPLSSHKLTFSPSHISGSSTSSFITRYSDSEAPIIDVESNSETTQIVETTEEETPKPEGVFAVVMIGSRQYIIFPGRFLTTQRLKGANVGDKIILNKVLLVGTKTSTYIGYPVVPDAVVHAVVEDQGLNDKVIVFKYKKKKNYQRNIGHRQPNTRIRITAITGYENSKAVTLESQKLEAEILETLKSQNSETLESLLETLEPQNFETLESLLETLVAKLE